LEESLTRRVILIGVTLIVLALVAALWLVRDYVAPPSENGFEIVSLQNNAVLISDADVLSYNWTSQEMNISDLASQRLLAMEDALYSFDGGFVIRIDGAKVYEGVFRAAYMSAVPAPPKISILFPSVFWPSSTENLKALMMFYPSGEPPSDQPNANAKLLQYFEEANKLQCQR